MFSVFLRVCYCALLSIWIISQREEIAYYGRVSPDWALRKCVQKCVSDFVQESRLFSDGLRVLVGCSQKRLMGWQGRLSKSNASVQNHLDRVRTVPSNIWTVSEW
jgi:hypothetical protein